MDNIKVLTEYDLELICSLWTSVFGEYEADLERIQIDGTECEYNDDTVFCAEENGRLIGTVHTTVPKGDNRIAGISGVCCLPEARGKGVARLLMTKAIENLRERGVHTVFLGTGNPVAAKLYSSFGFSYLAGSRVMASSLSGKGDIFGVCSGAVKDIKIIRGTPAFRIPLIGLINFDEKLIIADINAGIMGRSFFSQNSCMGLYPKYEQVRLKGGEYFGAVDKNGILGAIATIFPTDIGLRMDVCVSESFVSCLSDLIKVCEEQFDQIYFQIAVEDKKKVALIENEGFRLQKTVMHHVRDYCAVSTGIWRR